MRVVWIVILVGVFASLTQSCMPVGEAAELSALREKIGESCTVQFRRDALGTASTNPVPPLTGSMNGAETTVAGTLTAVKEDWIILKHRDNRELWIPMSNVLLLMFHIGE